MSKTSSTRSSPKPSLWCADRLSPGKKDESSGSDDGHRSPFEKDFDRILFSTPVRRLSDKTQVFPLDNNDGVRTRLTHSHEVSNLARSIGARIARKDCAAFDGQDLYQTVLPMLGAIGLAHDLGNPPFGHQGEAAIGKWFKERESWIFDRESETNTDGVPNVPQDHRNEFLSFDGNPQSFRLLTRLQTSVGKVGLDLTAAILAASIKYPVAANEVDEDDPIRKKMGYFLSEADIVDWVRERTGLRSGQRHPLTWIMEAADDIAYSVLDVEDAMKKGIISPDDLFIVLKNRLPEHPVLSVLNEDYSKADNSERPPKIIRDIKIAYARSRLIGDLVEHAASTFIKSRPAIFGFRHPTPLMEVSPLCELLKEIARTFAFGNSEVLFVEAQGRHAIESLLSSFWTAISTRKKVAIDSKRSEAFPRFVFSLFSSNYLEAATDNTQSGTREHAKRLRYRETRLLTDMISGMTDSFALDVFERVESVK